MDLVNVSSLLNKRWTLPYIFPELVVSRKKATSLIQVCAGRKCFKVKKKQPSVLLAVHLDHMELNAKWLLVQACQSVGCGITQCDWWVQAHTKCFQFDYVLMGGLVSSCWSSHLNFLCSCAPSLPTPSIRIHAKFGKNLSLFMHQSKFASMVPNGFFCPS